MVAQTSPIKASEDFSFLPTSPQINLAVTRSLLVVQQNGLCHFVLHLILHLVLYWLSIFFKMADHTAKTKVDFLI